MADVRKRWSIFYIVYKKPPAEDGGGQQPSTEVVQGALIFRPVLRGEIDRNDLARVAGCALAVHLEEHDAILLAPLKLVSVLSSPQVYSGLARFALPELKISQMRLGIDRLRIVSHGRWCSPAEVSPLASQAQDLHLDDVVAYLQHHGYAHAPLADSLSHVKPYGPYAGDPASPHYLIDHAAKVAEALRREDAEAPPDISPRQAAKALQSLAETTRRYASGCGDCLLRRYIRSTDDGGALVQTPTTPDEGPDSLCYLASAAAHCQGAHPLRFGYDVVHSLLWPPGGFREWIRGVRQADPHFFAWAEQTYKAATLDLGRLGLDGELTSSPDGYRFRPASIFSLLPTYPDLSLALGRCHGQWAIGLMAGEYTAKVRNATQWQSVLDPDWASLHTANQSYLARYLVFWYAITDLLELYGLARQWREAACQRRRCAYAMAPQAFVEQIFASIGLRVPEDFTIGGPLYDLPIRRNLTHPVVGGCPSARATILNFYDRSLLLQALVDRLRFPKGALRVQTSLPLVVA